MRALIILIAIGLGLLVPVAHHLTFLIRYSLILMLFFAFLSARFDKTSINQLHLKVLGLNLFLPFVVFFAFKPILGAQTAIAGFLVALAPTGAAAPVIALLLKTRVNFVTSAVLITNPIVAILLPIILPQLLEINAKIQIVDIFIPIVTVVFTPLILTSLIKRFLPTSIPTINKFSPISFWLFALNVFIASASSSNYLHQQPTAISTLLPIIAIVLFVCIVNYGLGDWLGRKANYPLATSLALGRKNTVFILWIALTYISPLVALGPMFYIISQNIYNSWLMWVAERKNALDS